MSNSEVVRDEAVRFIKKKALGLLVVETRLISSVPVLLIAGPDNTPIDFFVTDQFILPEDLASFHEYLYHLYQLDQRYRPAKEIPKKPVRTAVRRLGDFERRHPVKWD